MATLRLPQVAGWGNAMCYLPTGEVFGVRGGAEDRVRLEDQGEDADDALLARASEFAERGAKQAPLAVQASLEECARGAPRG